MATQVEISPDVWEALTPHIHLTRDGLLDARNGLMKSATIATKHDLPELHQDLMAHVASVDDLLEFVSPKVVSA